MIATSRTINTPKSQIAGTIQRPRDSGTYEISVTAAAKNSHPSQLELLFWSIDHRNHEKLHVGPSLRRLRFIRTVVAWYIRV